MAYFNHAFCKSFLVDSVVNLTGQTTSDLTEGQLGVVDGSWVGQNPAALSTTPANNLFYIAQGSYMPNDKIGTHGGYQESVKTKGINPRYVTRLWSSVCQDAQASTVTINVDETCAPCGDLFYLRVDVKGSPALRFLNHNAYAIGDSSGSAALNNNLPGICCVDGQEFLDPAVALAKAAAMLLEDPIITPFVREGQGAGVPGTLENISGTATAYTPSTTFSAVATSSSGAGTGATVTVVINAAGTIESVAFDFAAGAATGYVVGETLTVLGTALGGASPAEDVTFDIATLAAAGITVTVGGTPTVYSIEQVLDGTYTPSTDPVTDQVTAALTLEGSYVDTQFGDCSFDTRDHYEMEPVQLYASILDETGDPCNECGSTTRTEGVMAQTHGETVLRHILLHERYLQSPYHQGASDSVRIREIEGFDAIKAAVQRNALYKVYYIQHSIPRLNNPTGTFDNDQYVYQFFVPCLDGTGAENTVVLDAMDDLFAQLETVCGTPFGNPVAFVPDVDQL
jgi:hypothetical protein